MRLEDVIRRPIVNEKSTLCRRYGNQYVFAVDLKATKNDIANAVSAGIVVWFLMHEEGPYRLRWRSLRATKAELLVILKIGIPAGLQGVVFSLSNIDIMYNSHFVNLNRSSNYGRLSDPAITAGICRRSVGYPCSSSAAAVQER